MVLLESLDIPLGTEMPEFVLQTPDKKRYASRDLYGEKGLLVVITCNHCPYAIAVWPRVVRLAGYARGLGINTVAINPNIHPDYPEDRPEIMQERIREWGIDFPYLVDMEQRVAKDLKAQCTPDIYLFDAKGALAYHGRIDDNWQDESKVTREELKEAITHLAEGRNIALPQYPTIGCSIKWK